MPQRYCESRRWALGFRVVWPQVPISASMEVTEPLWSFHPNTEFLEELTAAPHLSLPQGQSLL